MRLSALAPLIEATLSGPDAEVLALALDSRKIQPGALFAAMPGAKADGLDFAPMALENGAAALLIPAGAAWTDRAVPALRAANVRRSAALAAARLAGEQPQIVAAVTGTNGKTSTAVFTRALWAALGHRAASLGTLGLCGPGFDLYEGLTTPDSATLHRYFAVAKKNGCDRVCLEASSHGLDQHRLDGVRVRAAAFTTLGRDHLDYHGDQGAYLKAKSRLFTDLLDAGGPAVLNADDACFARLKTLVEAAGRRVWSYGRAGETVKLLDRAPTARGQTLTLAVHGARHALALPLVGGFQAMNALAAFALTLATGATAAAALAALETLSAAPGRLELTATRANGAAVYVDYAHTPDALKAALSALRPHAAGRLVCVFGCGGERDPGKRPLMGDVARRLCDVAILTDDNPRGEDPAAIRAQARAGRPGALEIGDRRAAIRRAVAMLGPGDALIVAGKGHETGQIVGARTIPFDDRDEVRAAVAECDAGVPS